MKTTSFGVVGGTLLVLALAACERTQETEEPTGRVMLSITSAPADAACLRITAKGATTAVRLVPLMTGMSTVFPLEGLPLGPVDFTGEAFPVGCGMVGVNTSPTYVSEAVRVTLMDGETVNVAIVLRRPGRAVVSVDFPDAGQGGELPIGAACASDASCASGFCVDGVCCNTACIGTCQSCNRMPLGRCTPDPVGSMCSAATCMGNTAIPAGFCNAMTMCQPSPSQNCAPFACQNGACRTSCMTNSDCQAGFSCQNGTCVSGGLPNGSACSTQGQCASGFCASGVCCNTACTGLCQACNIMPGSCVPRAAGSTCGPPPSCMGSTLIPSPACNGAGACVSQMSRSCSPYLCQNAACGTSCASNADCVTGFTCQMGSCVSAGQPNGSACSAASQCASGFCASGVCCETACTGACQACNLAPGRCVSLPVGVVCAGQTCMGSTFVPPSTCNGTGMCVSAPPRSCAPFVCGMNACLTSCASDADCQPGLRCDSGFCRPPMPPMTVTVGAEADAYVRDGGAAAANFGTDPALPVKNSTTAGNNRIAYLRFPLGAVASVGQARLRLFGSRATASMLTDAVFAVPSNMWTETGITWNARPAVGSKLGASVAVGSTAQYHEWDVTAHVQAQKMAGASAVSLAVQMETPTGNSPDSFNAKEAGSNPPQLVITP